MLLNKYQNFPPQRWVGPSIILAENIKYPRPAIYESRGGQGDKLKLKILKTFCILIFGFCLVFGFWHFSSAQEEFKYNAKGKRNPFIPLVTSDGRILKLDKEEGIGGLSIEGIIYDEHGVSYAIVNGEVVKTGDKIGDYQVLKIEKDKIVFIKEGQPVEVELKKGEE